MVRLRLDLLIPLLLLTPAAATFGQVEFHFNYLDQGAGFSDPEFGAARRQALEESAATLESVFRNYSADLFIDVDGSQSGDLLASANSNFRFVTEFSPGFVDRGDVMIKILQGNQADPDPDASDGNVFWNFQDIDWELGDDFQVEEFDFISTAIHELLHTVGFGSNIWEDGTDAFETPPGSPGAWDAFDQFMADRNSVLIAEDFALDGDAWEGASVGGTENGLFFVGEHAVAANGGNPVPLYSPSVWEFGSSGSHLDDDFFNGQYMMESFTAPGPGIRTISELELAILRDLGYEDIAAALPTADFDGDGQLGVGDVDLLGLAVAAADNPSGFDLTGDGIVDLQDLDFLLAAASRSNGDADFDGEVGFADFLQLSGHFGQTGAAIRWSTGDFDADNAVQFSDFLILSTNFGQVQPAVVVPEPCAACAFLSTAIMLLSRRRKASANLRSMGSFSQSHGESFPAPVDANCPDCYIEGLRNLNLPDQGHF